MFLSRSITITKGSDRNRTASLYAAGVLGIEDINKIIGGQTVKVKKRNIPRRLLAEVVLMNDGDTIPLDTATDAEKEAFPKVIWYSNLGREADAEDDAVFIKDFYACMEALESGKRMTTDDEEETTEESGGEEQEETGSEGPGSEGTGSQETDTPEAPVDLRISDEAFAALPQEEQIKLVETLQEKSEEIGEHASKLAKKVASNMKRGVKDDARNKQLFELLKTLVKPKEVAIVEKLQETNTDPIKAATTFFKIDLLQAEKDVKKKPKQKSKKPGTSGEPDKPKQSNKPDGKADESNEPEEPEGDTDSDQPKPQPEPAANPKGVTLRGAAILASLRKNGMSDDDLVVMSEDIDARLKYDLGEIMDVVRELGYEDDSSVVQALSAAK